MKVRCRLLLGIGIYLGLFLLSAGVGSLAYFHFANPQNTCASCHEMAGDYAGWSVSAHRTLHCRNCHGGALTLDVHALREHVNRVVQHFTSEPGQRIHLIERDVLSLQESCRSCHPQSYVDWQSGRHSVSYARIFLDPDHNRTERVAADCLRCHGMFFDGRIGDLVTPLNTTGPWRLRDPAESVRPAIPCLACHEIHAPADRFSSSGLALYYRSGGERMYFPVNLLPAGSVYRDGQLIKISPDPRQRLCLQCHATNAAHQHGSSDDRVPTGVHEGLSCLDCHQSHTDSARASCSACHPADSHCGLDVEKMDTTFRSPDSKHDIHFVACGDCHEGQRPTVRGHLLDEAHSGSDVRPAH